MPARHRVMLGVFIAFTFVAHADAQTVTLRGTGTVEGWYTLSGGEFVPGAPTALESALPAGAPFTAAVTYDPAQVVSIWNPSPAESIVDSKSGFVGSCFAVRGETNGRVTRSASALGATAGQFSPVLFAKIGGPE